MQEGLEKIYHEQSKAYYSCAQAASTLAEKGLLAELLQKVSSKPKARVIPGTATTSAIDLTDEPSRFGQEATDVQKISKSTRKRPGATQRKEKGTTGGSETSANVCYDNIISDSDSESQPCEDEEPAGSNLSTSLGSLGRRARKRQLPSASIASGSALLEAVATVSQASKVKDTAAKMAKGNDEKKQPEVAKRQRSMHTPQVQDDKNVTDFMEPKVEPEAHPGSVSAAPPVFMYLWWYCLILMMKQKLESKGRQQNLHRQHQWDLDQAALVLRQPNPAVQIYSMRNLQY